jgi:lysophospholipase L1-like esterase
MTAVSEPVAAEPMRPPESPKQPPIVLSRRKRILFSLILTVVVLFVLEMIAGLYLRVTRGYDGTHLYEFEFDPYKNILPARNFVDTRGVQHNAVGFRRTGEVSKTKPANTYRIFLMGGSTAYGTGGLWPHLQRDFAVIKNTETIDAYLERILGEALPGKRIEVINAAITSTWTHHHLIYLNQTILGYDPDMVLFLDGYNDFFHVSPDHDQFGSFLYTTQASGILGEPTLGALARANAWWFYRKSALAYVTIRALRTLKLVVTSPFAEKNRPPMNVDRAMANLEQVFPRSALAMQRRTALILRDAGVVPVFMLQPMLILERGHKPMPEMEQQLFAFNVESYLPNYEQFIRRAVTMVHERETAMASELGAQFIDLTGIYGGVEEQIYTDYVHLTPRGNELLARYVADRLVPVIRQDAALACASDKGGTAC